MAESYAQLLADRTGVDVTRIWQWAFLERVSTGLYVLGFGSEAVGRPFLTSAERLLDP
jgi:streptomycin 6-kinase